MATHALFISPDDTILTGYIEENYDKDQIAAVIYDQQQLEIKPLIGSGLYAELESQINTGVISAPNLALLEKIRDAVRMYVLSDGMWIFTYKIRNKGVVTMSSENSQPSSLDGLVQLTQRFKDKAQVYAQRVTDYLRENDSSYPLYSNPGSGIDTIHPNRSNYSTGFYLGNSDYKCDNLDQKEV